MRRVVAAALCLVAALLFLAWWVALPARPGPFYSDALGAGISPGSLLKTEPFERGLPSGTRGWRILYQTTRADGSPKLASAVVIVPDRADGSPHPVVGYAHGTLGVASGCAPSMREDPFPGIPGFPELFERGWAFVGPDYPGLGTSGPNGYLIGRDSARAVLDALRAARAIPEAKLAARSVVWGHSQGGHAALWSAQIAADYAADVELLGVTAVAPAADLARLAETIHRAGPFGIIVASYLVSAYDAAYPGLRAWEHVAWPGRILVRDMARRCLEWPDILVSLVEARLVTSGTLYAVPPWTGAFRERLAENTPTGPFSMPVLIAQGDSDDVIPPEIQAGYVSALCARGTRVDFRRYPDRDHVTVTAPGSSPVRDLLDWSAARLSGDPAPATC